MALRKARGRPMIGLTCEVNPENVRNAQTKPERRTSESLLDLASLTQF